MECIVGGTRNTLHLSRIQTMNTRSASQQHTPWMLWWIVIGLLCLLGFWLRGPDRPIQRLDEVGDLIDSNGDVVLTSSGKVLSLADQRILRTTSSTVVAALSQNGEYAVVKPYHQRLQLFIYQLNDEQPPQQITLDSEHYMSVAISNNGDLVATGGSPEINGELMLWDLQSHSVIAKLEADGAQIDRIYFTDDDRFMLVVGVTSFRIIEIQTKNVVYRIDSHSVSFSLATHMPIAAMVPSGGISLLPLAEPQAILSPLPRIASPYPIIKSVGLNPDAQYLAVTRPTNRTISMWDPDFFGTHDNATAEMALVRISDGEVVQRFRGEPGAIGRPIFSADGKTIITNGPGKGISYWKVAPRSEWEQWLRTSPFYGALLIVLVRFGLGVRRMGKWVFSHRRKH
jgi:WD40 repeat protein